MDVVLLISSEKLSLFEKNGQLEMAAVFLQLILPDIREIGKVFCKNVVGKNLSVLERRVQIEYKQRVWRKESSQLLQQMSDASFAEIVQTVAGTPGEIKGLFRALPAFEIRLLKPDLFEKPQSFPPLLPQLQHGHTLIDGQYIRTELCHLQSYAPGA